MNKTITEWTDEDYLRRAYINARDMSDDPSTQNGSVLKPVKNPEHNLVYGANKLPRGISVPKEEIARWSEEKKSCWMCNAGQVAINRAASRGVPTEGATLYVPWVNCMACGRSIIESGIIRVVSHQQMWNKFPPNWMWEVREVNWMLDEAGVIRDYVDANLFRSNLDYQVLFRNEYWIP